MTKLNIFIYISVSLSILVSAQGADTTPSVAELQSQIQSLTQRLASLEAKENDNWLTEERTQQIRGIVRDVLADAQSRSPSAPGFGYDNGFFIQSSDRNFKLSIGGLVQVRYTFASDQVRRTSAFATQPKSGDVNGFDFRRARIILAGNIFTPNLTFNLTGDFAGDAGAKNPISAVATNASGDVRSTTQTSVVTDKNYFQIVDAYFAYRFSDAMNVRFGAFLTPFSRAEYMIAGQQLVDLPLELAPFDPQRSLGLSIFGQPIKNRFSYEVNVNDGQCSNILGRVGEISTSGNIASNAGAHDNRLAFYARLQYAGAGSLSDFADEPDLRKDNCPLAWMVEGAAGYESANTTSSAFPSPQGSVTTIPVGTITAPGFTTYPLNGNLYRGTLDASLKYQGWSFITACYFQQINESGAVAGSTAPTLPAGYKLTGPAANSSFFELGYYGQAGYMITPYLELVGRVGQFLTEGSSNRMEEYALGANYYLYKQNVKIQTDVTYVPNEAAYTSSCVGTAVNTQDVICRLQLQVKF